MGSEIEIRITILMMGVISILVLSGTIVNAFASGTVVNASAPVVKYAMSVGKLTKFILVNPDKQMWNNTQFNTICFTPDSEGGKVFLSSNSPSLIGTTVCPPWLPEK